MKFSIQRDDCYEAIQKVASVIPQRSTITMTQNILVSADSKQLELVTTDLEITMVSHVNADIETEGSVALPGRLVHDIIRELPNVRLTFESDANHRLVLTSDFGEYKIGGENPLEFPSRPQLSEVNEIVLPNPVLKQLIDKTIFACSSDELRPALTGVFFEVGEGKIRTVATDGHRLAMLDFVDEALPADMTHLIASTRALNFVLRSLEQEGMTAILFGEQHILFHMDNTQLFARLIDDDYVDYHRVLPKETNFDLIVDTNQFQSAVRRVSLFANPITAKVVLNISPERVRIEAQDADYGGEAKEELPCEFNGETFEIGFNSRYLQQILRHVDAPRLIIQMIRPDYAVLVKPTETPEHEEQLMLLMPIRLD